MTNNWDEEAYYREQREEEERVWDLLYTTYPPPAGTEAKQARHRELNSIDDPTPEQEQESNALFCELFPFTRKSD